MSQEVRNEKGRLVGVDKEPGGSLNSEPNPSLNSVTSVPESEGEAQRKRERQGEADAEKQTHLSDLKKEEIKSSRLG